MGEKNTATIIAWAQKTITRMEFNQIISRTLNWLEKGIIYKIAFKALQIWDHWRPEPLPVPEVLCCYSQLCPASETEL